MTDNRSPSLADVIDHGVQTALGDLRVALPGKVKSYDAAKQSAHVQPILKQTYVDENDVEQSVAFPVIPNVPVMFPGAGGFRITFPLAAGDDVLLVFSDYGLDKYLSNGGATVDPVALHQHALVDAIAIPGLHPFNKPWAGASTSNMTLGADGGPQVHLTPSSINLGAAAAHEAMVLGTTYRASEDALLSVVLPMILNMAAVLTIATTAPPVAAVLVPPPGPALKAALATFLSALPDAIAAFNTASATYLSTVVKGT